MLLAAELYATPLRGLFVEAVRKGSMLERVGLKPGDVLLRWRRASPFPANPSSASGEFQSTFDLESVFVEQLPRGSLTLTGTRGSSEVLWQLPGGAPWSLVDTETVPSLGDSFIQQYKRGKELVERGDLEGGVRLWRAMSDSANSQGDRLLASWLLVRTSQALAKSYRWPDAESSYRESLAVVAGDKGLRAVEGQILRQLGDLYLDRRLWDRGRECYRRALTIDRRLAKESLTIVFDLIDLGYVDNLSGGSKDDRRYFRDALKILQHLAPGSSVVAMGWLQWGNAAALDGDYAAAAQRYERALTLEPRGHGELGRIEILGKLGYARELLGEDEAAERVWQEGLSLADREAPEDVLVTEIVQGLGRLAIKKGDLRTARPFLERALKLTVRDEPGGLGEAAAHANLGKLERQAGNLSISVNHLCKAMGVVENWRKRFETIEEVRVRWGVFFASYYRDCAEARVEAGQKEQAFQDLERGRARAFLNLLAERPARASEATPQYAKEWRHLHAEYDRTTATLARIRAKSGQEANILNLEGKLREIRRRRAEIQQAERSVRTIQYPEPLTLSEARSRLDPGTVLLLYSIGNTRTLLFVLAAPGAEFPGWAFFSLPVGEPEITRRVRAFRDVLVNDRNNEETFKTQAKALYDLLIRPADTFLGPAKRILISPDGALHTLPFAALIRDENYLIEWKPLHYALSATVYSELLKERRAPVDLQKMTLVAFDDPSYPQAPGKWAGRVADPVMREAIRRGLSPLPSSRNEVDEIAGFFSRAQIFEGRNATEENVRAAARGADVLHFAVHGLINERTPVNSALILSLPKARTATQNNGLLEAWEVMDDLSLNADLVVLSACDTALGRENRGEGLIGLTRAFQYAGARSVLATLWGISDRSTAGLMRRFYAALRAGKSKDEALREAQIDQIKSQEASQPFYWAAFELFGNWY